MQEPRPETAQRGIALVISLLSLLGMSLLGMVFIAGVSMNRSLAGNDQRLRQTLNIAEAGLGEAESRISNQDVPMDPADANDVCQIFNAVPGSVPVLGADSTALATGQAAGSYLNYTTPGRGPDVLTIAWKKNAGAVMRYDATKNPALNTVTGIPVYTITSTGRVNQTRRTIVADVIQRPYQVNAKGALCASIPIGALGNSVICGFDHKTTTPYDDGTKGRLNPAPIPPNDPQYCQDNEVAGVGLPGMWTTGTVNPGGTYQGYGNPGPFQANQVGFYSGPWDAVGLSQAEYWSFVGSPQDPSAVTDWNGLRYIDNNSTTQDASASLALHSVDGEGYLYVDGDLHLNAGFHYRGLIYVEGNFDINGQAWVLGGIIVKGSTSITANGGMTLLYSSETIKQELTKYGGQFVTLNWREQ